MRSRKRGKALITGYGGGKTHATCLESIKHSMIDRGYNKPHMLVSPSFPQAKKTVIPTMHELLTDQFGLKIGKDYTYNKSDHEFRIKKWKGLVWIGSGRNPDSLNGPNLCSFGIDEPGQQSHETYIKMLARLRHPKAKELQWWLTGTPEGLNWLYDVCEGEKVPKEFDLIRGRTTDNTDLPQSFIDDLYDQYDSLLVDAYIDGKFVNMSDGSAYHAYCDDNVIQGFNYDPNRPIFVGMDFNYDPMCSVIGQEVIQDGVLKCVIFDEFHLKNCDTDAAAEQIIDKYGDPKKTKYEIYPDPSCKNRNAHGVGKSDLKILRNSFGANTPIRIVKNTRRKNRLNAMNKMLRNANGISRLLLTPNVKKLKNDFRRATMREYLNGNFDDPAIGHISDGCGYLVEKRYPVRYKKPYEKDAA